MAGVTLGSNIGSLAVQRRLDAATSRLAAAFQRLSSGSRINKTSDDAAALAIASALNTDIRVFTQALRNVNDGISMANIAEGALEQLKNITYRQIELAAQAASSTYSPAQKKAMNLEANELVSEYNRIVASTTFNGSSLFGDNPSPVRIQAAGSAAEPSLMLALGEALSRNVGDGTFLARQAFTTGSSPYGIAAADFDRDGKLDLVTADRSGNSVSVLIGNGDGTFKAREVFTVGGLPVSVAAADFNADGKVDLVTVDSGNSSVSVLLGNGDGTFQERQAFTTDSARVVAVADIDNDGKIDLVTGNTSDSANILIGNGDGTFKAKQSCATTGQVNSIALTDFNGDGKLDLVTADYTGGKLSLFLGNADGTFSARKTLAFSSPYSVVVGDYNGDGIADIAAGDAGGFTGGLFLGNGDGTFRARQTISRFCLGSTDFNGDGRTDLVGYHGGVTGSILLNNGDATFQATPSFTMGTSPQALALADFNGDGRVDLASADSGSSTASVLLANGPSVSTTPYLNINTRQGGFEAMAVVKASLQRIEGELGSIGAVTSRFSVALATLQARRENEAAAYSRITDADIAEETANLTRAKILQQTGAALLGQVNQAPQLALKLLEP